MVEWYPEASQADPPLLRISKLTDYGIPDDFIRQLGQTIKPNSSALFLLVQKVTADKVLPRMAGFKGHVLKTSLSDDREKRLREALGDTGPASA